jgi:hypothetical protein
MTLLILCIAAVQISEPSGSEVAEVCLPWFHRALNRAVEPLSSNRLADDHANNEYFFHNRDAATPNFSVKPTAGRSPLSGLKPLFPRETHGVTPVAGRQSWLRTPRRQPACRSARRHAGPRCGLH